MTDNKSTNEPTNPLTNLSFPQLYELWERTLETDKGAPLVNAVKEELRRRKRQC